MVGLGWLARWWRPPGAAPAVSSGRRRLGLYVRLGVGTLAALLGLLAVVRVPASITHVADPISPPSGRASGSRCCRR